MMLRRPGLGAASALAALLAAPPRGGGVGAFRVPPPHRGPAPGRRDRRPRSPEKWRRWDRGLALRMADGDGEGAEAVAEEVEAAAGEEPEAESEAESESDSEAEPEEGADAAARAAVASYKSALSPRRSFGSGARPGSYRPASSMEPLDVTMKFGGSSLANAERVDRVTRLIRDRINPPDEENGERPVRARAVICSAMGKTTNSLLAAGEMALEGRVDVDALRTLHLGACRDFDLPQRTTSEVKRLLDECQDMLNGVRLIQELSPKSLDQLVSYGERCSVRIVAARLNQIGVPAQAFDAWDVGVFTDDTFGDAKLLPGTIDSIRERFAGRIDPNVVAVVTGFIGHNTKGRITTLGRGGSDLTATAIGAALNVDEVQVWKDVDGILTADPRLVENAIPVSQVSYEEASELAYFGAQVLHPIAMQPALRADIPVRVKNSYNPSAPGSVIDRTGDPGRTVTAITCKHGVTLVDVRSLQMLGAYGFLGAVFAEFEKHRVSVDVLASSEVSVSVTLDKKQAEEDVDALCLDLGKFAQVELRQGRAILTLIADVGQSSDVLATVFRSFSAHGIKVEMMSQGASKVNISFIVREEQIDDAILNLHSCFFEDRCDVGIVEGGQIFETSNNA